MYFNCIEMESNALECAVKNVILNQLNGMG